MTEIETTLHDNSGCRITATTSQSTITYLTMTGEYGSRPVEIAGAVMFPRELRALAIALLQVADQAERMAR